MSGLCGWVGGSAATAPDDFLNAMESALPHHGPITRQAAAGATFGIALATHPETSHWYADNRVVAAIEGYPTWSHPEWRDIAAKEGHGRALAAAFEATGEAALQHLRGPVALAVVDHARDRAVVAIDRFGTASLCYTCPDPRTLVFGSTTDSVRAHGATSLTVSPQAIFDFIYFIDRVPAPETIYREARKLVPGQCITFDRGRVEVKSYWRMPYAGSKVDPGRVGALREELVERMSAAIARCLAGEADRQIGAFLSGGLDSSTIVGLLSRISERPAKAVTIGFDVSGFDETRYAELAARHFGAEHNVYYLRPEDTLDAVEKIAAIYDEPFANSSAVPAYVCALKAREAGVELMLAGDGGDELFAGNARYIKDGVFDHYQRLPRPMRRWLIEPALAHIPGRNTFRLLGKPGRYVQSANTPAPVRLYRDNLYASHSPDQVFVASALEEIDIDAPARFAVSVFEGAGTRSKLQKMMWLDLRLTLADSDIRKVGRMCELAGIRVKYPFLDEDLAEFSARLPPDLLMAGGRLRGFYKDAFQGFLPDKILTKKKHGFGLPYLAFTRAPGPLRDLLCDNLSALGTRRYFRRSFIDEVIKALHTGGPDALVSVAWDIALLEVWLRSRAIS